MAELLAMRVLALGLSLCIFLQAYILRQRTGTWLSPGSIFAVYWGLMTIIPIVLVQDAAPVMGTFVAFIMVLMFSAGTTLVITADKSPYPQRAGLYDTPVIYWSLVGTAVIALGCLLVNSSIQGISFDRLFSFEAAAEYTEARYSGDLVSNIFIQLATVLAYVAATLCGLALGKEGRWRSIIVFLGLLPTLFVLVTQSAKGALLLAGALIAAGHFVRAIDARETRFISKATTKRLPVYVAVIAPLIIISFVARGLYGAIPTSELLFQLNRYALSYSSGHMFAFSDWIAHYWGSYSELNYSSPGTAPGFYTFMSIARMLGDTTEVPPGTYAEYFAHSDILQTNVYTMYRGLITDFSFGGAMVFMFFCGTLAQLAYRGILSRNYSAFACVCFIIFVAATQQSAYISFFQYNSAYALGAALFLIFSANYGFWRSRQREANERKSRAAMAFAR